MIEICRDAVTSANDPEPDSVRLYSAGELSRVAYRRVREDELSKKRTRVLEGGSVSNDIQSLDETHHCAAFEKLPREILPRGERIRVRRSYVQPVQRDTRDIEIRELGTGSDCGAEPFAQRSPRGILPFFPSASRHPTFTPLVHSFAVKRS